ncbi:MAG: hypothetical protein JNG85_11645 [Spirochaetaceae bacterium]|nr:hypothetical protein [Spirochaetaceae bacterium]
MPRVIRKGVIAGPAPGLLLAAALTASLAALAACGAGRPARGAERRLSGSGFTLILHDGVPKSDGEAVLQRLEANAARIAADLGVEADRLGTRTVHLWGYARDYENSQAATIGAAYSGSTGSIVGPYRLELLNVADAPEIATHEYAHTVSLLQNRRFTNRPRWLWEALALYENGEFKDPRRLDYLAAGDYPTLAELGEDFNDDRGSIYEVGYLLLAYLKETWGMPKVLELVRNGGDLGASLGLTEAAFEAGWKTWVEERYFPPRAPNGKRLEASR